MLVDTYRQTWPCSVRPSCYAPVTWPLNTRGPWTTSYRWDSWRVHKHTDMYCCVLCSPEFLIRLHRWEESHWKIRICVVINEKDWMIQFFTYTLLLTLAQYTFFPKRNATLISRYLWWPRTRVSDPRSCTPREMTFGQKFTDLHSSPKDRQLQKSCVSFGEECIACMFCISVTSSCLQSHIPARFGKTTLSVLRIWSVSSMTAAWSAVGVQCTNKPTAKNYFKSVRIWWTPSTKCNGRIALQWVYSVHYMALYAHCTYSWADRLFKFLLQLFHLIKGVKRQRTWYEYSVMFYFYLFAEIYMYILLFMRDSKCFLLSVYLFYCLWQAELIGHILCFITLQKCPNPPPKAHWV